MIKQSDLINRVNDDIFCVAFDYMLNVDDEKIRCRFTRDKDEPLVWNMMVIMKRDRDADSQVYNFGYQLPKYGMSLTMIAAIGLKYFQMYLKQEIQKKMNMDFMLGEVVSGMVG